MTGAWPFIALFLLSALLLAAALLVQLRPPGRKGLPDLATRGATNHLPDAEVSPTAVAAVSVGSKKPSGSAELQRQLLQAGFSHPQAAHYFNLAKIFCAGLGLLLSGAAVLLEPRLAQLDDTARIGLVILTATLSYAFPVKLIDHRRHAYLKRIGLALPDALDFMLISVEAGQSTDLAVMRVAEELQPVHPDLAAQFAALTEALAAGADRQDAWHKMALECSNDDLRQLASIIVQSSAMGTPMAHTLRVFAADLRDRHVRRVEERANVLPTKMTLGTMLFTIPPLLLLLLSPAIFRILQTF